MTENRFLAVLLPLGVHSRGNARRHCLCFLLPRGSAPIILEDLRQILKYRLRRYSLCLGALPLLYPAAPPSVFAFGKYTALAVALGREYVVELQGVLSGFLRS